MSRQASIASSADETRAAITRSLFAKLDEDGNPEESLIAFLKVHEEDHGSIKSRYLMLASTRGNRAVIHKCKRNQNGTFSRGKTWQLEDMRELEEITPTEFALTMTIRRYVWITERPREQHAFLTAVAQTCKAYMGQMPQLVNFTPNLTPSPTAGMSAASRIPPGMPMAPSASQTSVQGYDVAPVGSYSSAEGFRARVGSSSSRAERPDLRPGSSASRDYGSSVGLGRPPARRGSSDDRGPGPRLESSASNYPQTQRRPSGTGSIPPIHEPPEDPYGGIEDEVLRSPGLNGHDEGEPSLLIPPVASPPSPHNQLSPPVSTKSPALISTKLTTPSSTKATTPMSATSPAVSVKPVSPLSTTSALPTVSVTPTKNDDDAPRPRQRDPLRPPMDVQRRVSFVPPALTTAYSRDVLLTTRTGLLGADVGLGADEDEAADAIMANVEELTDGFDWTQFANSGDPSRKGPDAIEKRLLDELAALESANIHAFLESDDRVDQVIAHIDEALLELDDMDAQLTGYRMQLNAVSEDIEFIEGQNRGLQVQTSNQHALLNEIQQLLQITDVPKSDLAKLAQVSPSTARGVQELEQAAASLYKALMASRDAGNEVAATVIHVQEYQGSSTQFAKRIVEYLDIAFKHQSDSTLSEFRKRGQSLSLAPHTTLGEALMMYEGLVLFVKDMDEVKYKTLCTNYLTTMSKLHQQEMQGLLKRLIEPIAEESRALSGDGSFVQAAGSTHKPSVLANPVQRVKTVRRPGSNAGVDEPRKDPKAVDATRHVSELYSQGMSEVVNQIVTEDDFINAFLHLADTESTFADYMELDTYFRRQAARHASRGMSPSLTQLARSVMELMFGFVDGEFKQWIEVAVKGNPLALVGVIATTEKLAKEAEQEGTSLFLLQLFDKQLGRQRQTFEAFVNEQIKSIDNARQTIKKRRRVFPFVRHFPVFVERIECQLDNCDSLEIRKRVNDAYERAVASVLASLQHCSKIVGAELGSDDDKGQLYNHVVMIENLNIFVDEVGQLGVPALSVYVQRARGLFEENMKAYIKMMLRRGFARLMDFFDGVERQLKAAPAANEVILHPAYNKSALKKTLKESGAKDMRKAIEAMARRVDKHFSDDDSGSGVVGAGAASHHPTDPATVALIGAVWREISTALAGEVGRAVELIGRCYGDTGLSLEYTVREVESVSSRAHR